MYISLQFKLHIDDSSKQKLLELMRKQSSAIRSAYKMLKDKIPPKDIYRSLRDRYPELPSRYIDSVIYKASQYKASEKVIFGGRKLFEKLCKNHLQGKQREKLIKKWRERRQGNLISVGSKTDKGNRLTRFEYLNDQLCLRITVGNREFI